MINFNFPRPAKWPKEAPYPASMPVYINPSLCHLACNMLLLATSVLACTSMLDLRIPQIISPSLET
jgi:hypothetical protein